MNFLDIDKDVNYRNFGYIPSGNLKNDLLGKMFGHKNLYKRLQAKDIINFMNLGENEKVLDLGCGGGFFTIEFAKKCSFAVGVDIVQGVGKTKVPIFLKNKLSFIEYDGICLPFEDNFFEVVFLSEVLPMISDYRTFLSEVKRVLKNNGRVIVSNGAGHPTIKDIYVKKRGIAWWFINFLYQDRLPSSYEEYEEILQKSFGTTKTKFLRAEDIEEIFMQDGFRLNKKESTPKFYAGTYFSWSQFLLYLRTGNTLSQHNFYLKYFLLSLLTFFQSRKHQGGPLLEFTVFGKSQ